MHKTRVLVTTITYHDGKVVNASSIIQECESRAEAISLEGMLNKTAFLKEPTGFYGVIIQARALVADGN